MRRIFAALVISYGLVVGAAFVFGWLADSQRHFAAHFALGLFATVFTCFIYCVVLTYLIITGKMVKQAVLARNLDRALIERSQRLKGRLLLLMVIGCGTALAAALLGAGCDVPPDEAAARRAMHLIAEIIAVTANLGGFFVIYSCICRQSSMIGEVFEQFAQRQASDRAG